MGTNGVYEDECPTYNDFAFYKGPKITDDSYKDASHAHKLIVL